MAMDRRLRFLAIWAATVVVMLAMVAGINIIIDPYEMFGWQRIAGINEFKPGTRSHVAMSKAYQIERARPVTVILGTSRTYVAMDAASSLWPVSYRPVYNYGTPQTNMSEVMYRELQQAWATGRLRHAMAILDVPAFLTPDPPIERGPDQRRLLLQDDSTPNPEHETQRLSDTFLSVLTIGALVDSVKTILSRKGGDTVLDLRPDGTANAADFLDAVRAEGANPLFTQKDGYDLWRVPGFQQVSAKLHGPMPNMNIVRDMIAFCLTHDVTLTLILGSSHVDQMEIYRQAGLWPMVEKLKTDLAQVVADAHSDSITVWDFVEYAPYTTEKVPPPGDRVTRLKWFWEPVHFQRALGEIMLHRVFDGTPADFGAPLTPETVAARNAQVRAQQRGFSGWHLACEAVRPSPCTAPVPAQPLASTAER